MLRLRVSTVAMGAALAMAAALCSAGSLPAQEGRVYVVKTGDSDKELRRSAYRLHIPPERLKNVREALQEATDLALRLEPGQGFQAGQLGSEWVRLNRSKAKARIEGLIEHFRTRASEAKTVVAHQQATVVAGSLISQLAALDAEKSLAYVRTWPAAPRDGSEGPVNSDRAEEMLRRQLLQQLASQNPDLALQMLEENSGSVDYWVRGALAQRLYSEGRKDEAGRLLDRALSDFSSSKGNPGSVTNFGNYLGFLARVDQDRFLAALPAWIDAAGKSATPPGATLMAGEREISLTGTETIELNLLRNIQFGRTGLFAKALEMFPELKAKADAAGGVDALMGARFAARPQSGGSAAQPARGSVSTGGVRASPGSTGGETDLYQDFRSRQSRDSSGFRNTLAQLARDPEKVRTVLDFAARVSYEDPDTAATALEYAQPSVLRMVPLSRRAEMYQYLVRAWRQCDGEVDNALLKEGFIIADDLRSEAGSTEPEVNGNIAVKWSPADALEAMVLAELARNSFELAIRHVRSLPDGQLKLSALFQIIQAVSQP